MNWIRDNIIKIVVGIFIVIIVAIVVVACSMGGETVPDNASGYIELENRLQNAAIKYVKEHPKVLPTTTDTIKKIKLDTLVESGKINKIYAVDDGSVACKGYVEIEKIYENKNEYTYTPYLSCGKYYVTKTISDYVLEKETKNGEFVRTADDGLYPYGEDYIFRGEYPDNFILLGSRLYRIVKVEANGQMELISTERTNTRYNWDDRYNISIDRGYGINEFDKSRLKNSLEFAYENTDQEAGEVFFSELEKTYFVEHDFCIGKRDVNDKDIFSNSECSATVSLIMGLPTISEFARASIDPNCNGISEPSCSNYNYFVTLDTQERLSYHTLTAVSNNTYEVFKIEDSNVVVEKASRGEHLVPVVYISNRVIYKSGSGTYLDPYVVR